MLELYEATFDKRWLERALELNRTVIERYGDRRAGGFFLAPGNQEPRVARIKDARDGATPAGNSMQLMNLLRLSAITGDRSLRHWADQTMSCFAADVLQFPTAGARFLAAAEFALTGPVEVTVVGDQSSSGAQQLWRHIHSRYLPNRVLLHADPAHPQRNIAARVAGEAPGGRKSSRLRLSRSNLFPTGHDGWPVGRIARALVLRPQARAGGRLF